MFPDPGLVRSNGSSLHLSHLDRNLIARSVLIPPEFDASQSLKGSVCLRGAWFRFAFLRYTLPIPSW